MGSGNLEPEILHPPGKVYWILYDLIDVPEAPEGGVDEDDVMGKTGANGETNIDSAKLVGSTACQDECSTTQEQRYKLQEGPQACGSQLLKSE